MAAMHVSQSAKLILTASLPRDSRARLIGQVTAIDSSSDLRQRNQAVIYHHPIREPHTPNSLMHIRMDKEIRGMIVDPPVTSRSRYWDVQATLPTLVKSRQPPN